MTSEAFILQTQPCIPRQAGASDREPQPYAPTDWPPRQRVYRNPVKTNGHMPRNRSI